jgi:hypothetical protein
MTEQPTLVQADMTFVPSMAPVGAERAFADGEAVPSPEPDGWVRDAQGQLRRVDSDG